MKILELTLDDILELGQKPDPHKFMSKVQIRKMIDNAFWELIEEGKTTEEALEALGLGMPKGDGRKPEFEKAQDLASQEGEQT